MISKKTQGFLSVLLLSAAFGLPNSGNQQAFAANEYSAVSTVAQLVPVVTVTTVTTVPSVLVFDAHTGSKFPSSINMVVGQELLFKGNNAIDLMTLRYHQIAMHHSHDGNDPLQDEQASGYKGSFLAVAPGETKLDVGWNTLFYGLAPWGSHSIQVNVIPADSRHQVAETTDQVRQ